MNMDKVKREIQIVQKALLMNKEGYDADGYNKEGKDCYGRPRELMEEATRQEHAAFDSLTEEEQSLVMQANSIMERYTQKAIEWESQPLAIMQQSPFYEDYAAHSDITKHSCLIRHFLSKEEITFVDHACHLLITAKNKLFPPQSSIHNFRLKVTE